MHKREARAVSIVLLTSLLWCASTDGSRLSGAPAPSPSQANTQNASAELAAIMQRTLNDMLATSPCSSADPYFASAILPHRVGAVEMCDWMAQYGSDPQLLNISSAVYLSPTENQIYQTMPYLEACSPSPAVSPVSSAGLRAKAINKISTQPGVAIRSSIAFNLPASTNGNPDHDFALQMLAHHQASINMARVELLHGKYEPLKSLASQLIVVQTQQVGQFRQILQNQYATYI